MAKPAENNQAEIDLDEFSLDDEVTFFGITPEKDEMKELVKQVKTENKTKVEKEKKEENKDDKDEVEEPEPEFTFGEPKSAKEPKVKKVEKKEEATNEDESNQDTEDKGTLDTDDDDEDDFHTTLALELQEKKGWFKNVEIPKDKKLTEEEFLDLEDDEVEARVQETFEAFAEEMDEDGRDFIKFKKNGGKTEDFLGLYISELPFATLDTDDDNQVEQTLRYYYATVEELDKDEIKDKLEWLEEKGRTKTEAEKIFNKLEVIREKEKKALLERIEKTAKAKEESVKTFNKHLGAVLANVDKVGSLVFGKEDKNLDTYITKPTVKVGKNSFITQFQADWRKIMTASTDADKKELLALAKIVRDKFQVKGLEKEIETAKTREVKSKLQEAKNNPKKSNSFGGGVRSITDFF